MHKPSANSALIVVDVQNDFCPGGSLAAPDGDVVIEVINKLRQLPAFKLVVFTRDWHPREHVSFALNHDDCRELDTITVDGVEVIAWPVHCVQHSHGAELHPKLLVALPSGASGAPWEVFDKGTDAGVEEFSAFGSAPLRRWSRFAPLLRGRGVDTLYICGLATDYCVVATAEDARRFDFDTWLVHDAVKGVAEETVATAMQRMRDAGVHFISSSELLHCLPEGHDGRNAA